MRLSVLVSVQCDGTDNKPCSEKSEATIEANLTGDGLVKADGRRSVVGSNEQWEIEYGSTVFLIGVPPVLVVKKFN